MPRPLSVRVGSCIGRHTSKLSKMLDVDVDVNMDKDGSSQKTENYLKGKAIRHIELLNSDMLKGALALESN